MAASVKYPGLCNKLCDLHSDFIVSETFEEYTLALQLDKTTY